MIIRPPSYRSSSLGVLALLICGTLRAESNPLCGPECLYTALIALDAEPGTYASFLERVGDVDARGTSLSRLGELAEEFGMSTLMVQTTLENLVRRQTGPPFACIAHVDGDHFVLIGEVETNTVWIVNPPGEGLVATSVFRKRWPGHALLIASSRLVAEEELPKDSATRLTLILAVAGAMLLMLLGWSRIRPDRSQQ